MAGPWGAHVLGVGREPVAKLVSNHIHVPFMSVLQTRSPTLRRVGSFQVLSVVRGKTSSPMCKRGSPGHHEVVRLLCLLPFVICLLGIGVLSAAPSKHTLRTSHMSVTAALPLENTLGVLLSSAPSQPRGASPLRKFSPHPTRARVDVPPVHYPEG